MSAFLENGFVDVNISTAATQSTGRYGVSLALYFQTGVALERTEAVALRQVTAFASEREARAAGSGSQITEEVAGYMARRPMPPPLLQGGITTVAQPALIFGRAFDPLAAAGLGDGATIRLAGRALSVDFNGLTMAQEFADEIETQLNAESDITGADVTPVDGALRVSIPNFDVGLGFDDSAALLGLHGDGVNVLPAIASEADNMAAGLDRIRSYNCDWRSFVVTPDFYELSTSTALALQLAAYCNTSKDQVATTFDVWGRDVLAQSDTTSLAAQLNAGDYTGVSWIYNGLANQRAAIRYVSIFSARNLDDADSVIIAHGQRLPGITPVTLTTTERTELDRKNGNYYVQDGEFRYVINGKDVAGDDGEFSDIAWYRGWLGRELAAAAKRGFIAASDTDTSVRVTPQTNAGYSMKKEYINQVITTGLANGGISPGQLSDEELANFVTITGMRGFDGFLSNGSFIYVPPISVQTRNSRDEREDQPAYVFVTLSGGVQKSTINVLLTP